MPADELLKINNAVMKIKVFKVLIAKLNCGGLKRWFVGDVTGKLSVARPKRSQANWCSQVNTVQKVEKLTFLSRW